MAEVILMPRLSDTMTEGVIAVWHKNVGDTVKKGDVLAEIETDKATMDLESYQDGTLLHLGTPNGGKLQVNDLMAIIGKSGEDISALVAQHSKNNSVPISEPSVTAKASEPTPVPPTIINEAIQPVITPHEGRIIASPLAKKLAEEKNIDLLSK